MKRDEILLIVLFILIGGVVSYIFLTTTVVETPPLSEAIKFCEGEYNGSVVEFYDAKYFYHSCKLPNGTECDIYALYEGVCLNYEGKK